MKNASFLLAILGVSTSLNAAAYNSDSYRADSTYYPQYTQSSAYPDSTSVNYQGQSTSQQPQFYQEGRNYPQPTQGYYQEGSTFSQPTQTDRSTSTYSTPSSTDYQRSATQPTSDKDFFLRKGTISDADLESRVRDELRDYYNVNVRVSNGVLLISGTVRNDQELRKIQAIIQRVNSGRQIDNRVRITTSSY